MIAALLGQILHGCFLGQVLPDESVGVLIGASFPRVIRGAEIEFSAPFFLDCGVSVELGTVVRGDGFKHLRCPCDELVEPSICGGGGVVVELSNQRETTGPFNEREDAMGCRSMDGVDFPMTKFLS